MDAFAPNWLAEGIFPIDNLLYWIMSFNAPLNPNSFICGQSESASFVAEASAESYTPIGFHILAEQCFLGHVTSFHGNVM